MALGPRLRVVAALCTACNHILFLSWQYISLELLDSVVNKSIREKEKTHTAHLSHCGSVRSHFCFLTRQYRHTFAAFAVTGMKPAIALILHSSPPIRSFRRYDAENLVGHCSRRCYYSKLANSGRCSNKDNQ